MGWIKRNLFFVVGGILTLALLGGAGFFIYKGWSNNADASQRLAEIDTKLQELNQSPVQPGNEKIDNIKKAKDEEQQVREWINQATTYFRPIPPIPQGEVTSKTYASALNSTVYQLQQEAKDNSVNLPPQYYFSFQVQSSKLTISSGLGPLAQQLGEVKNIVEILYAARVNELEGIQRVRVSDDDATGLQSDYVDRSPVTNNLSIITPYVVTFKTFTPELARVLSGFASAPSLFIVKSVSVTPVGGSSSPDAGAPSGMPQPYPVPPTYGMPPQRYYRGMPQPQAQQPAAPQPAKGGLQTVLKEQLLRITMEVEIVKLLPKS